ncbi:MAG: ABC transporter permease [Chitinophagaceae bacterium]|nr:MAG: ABC transporter permease [Chitinophagaceae bacterium]
MPQTSFSFGQQVWQRLKKRRAAFVSLIIILLAAFVAIFGYLIAPDNTPFADLQTVEIQARKPGYEQLFLKIPHNKAVGGNALQHFFFGKPSAYNYLPITSYKVEANDLVVQKYVDEDTTVEQRYMVNVLTQNQPKKINNLIVTKKFWLGTDAFGRDILSRIIIGTRVSLAVGLIAVIISLSIGTLLGAMAGYYRGWVDEVIMWLVNVTWSIPTLLLVFAITMAMGKGFWQIFIAVGLTMWVSVARLVRGQVIALRELEYVQAAKALGYKNARIIVRHILPNILGPLLVIAAGNFATAIIVEAGLSFLGIGVQPPQPSWGLMIKENYNFIITNNPMLALVPGFAIMILVLAFNLLGNGLRDAVDVK